MFSLEKLCIDLIVQKFEQFHFAFTVSKDQNQKRDFNFLQRRYPAELATALYDIAKLKEEYFELLINEHLNFLDGEWIKKSNYLNSMEEIFFRLPNLTRISFKYWGDDILENVAKYCPKIVEIDVRCSGATDNGVNYLCEIKNGMIPCPKIKIIFIENTFVTDIGAACLCRNLPSLEKFDYPNIPLLLHSIHERNLHESGKIQLYNLVELNLLQCDSSSHVLTTCLTVCPKLESLSVYIDDEDEFNSFINIHLKKLHLMCRYSGPNINIDNFLKLNGQNLTSLKISDCTMSISVLRINCPMLKQFFAKRVDFTDDDDRLLKPNFEFLTECEFTNIETTFYKEVSLLLSFSPKLEAISFDSCIQLAHKLKTQILLWCKIPCAKKIVLKWICMDDEIEFLRDVLLNCPSLENMLLFDVLCLGSDSEWEEIEDSLQDLAKSLPNKPKIIIF